MKQTLSLTFLEKIEVYLYLQYSMTKMIMMISFFSNAVALLYIFSQGDFNSKSWIAIVIVAVSQIAIFMFFTHAKKINANSKDLIFKVTNDEKKEEDNSDNNP